MKRVGLGILVGVGLFVLALWLTHDPLESDAARRRRAADAPGGADPTLQGRERPGARDGANEAAAPEGQPASWGIVGTVLGEGRLPAEGVRVRVYTDRTLQGEVRTDVRGAYRVVPRAPSEATSLRVTAVADAGDGRVVRECRWTSSRREKDLGFRPLILGLGHELKVRVVAGGAPVEGADVEVRAGGMRRQGLLVWARTGPDGVARVAGLPVGLVQLLVTAEGLADRGLYAGVAPRRQEPLVVELTEPRSLDVVVVRMPENTPLAGVSVSVRHRLQRAHGHTGMVCRSAADIPPTDASGRTRIEGLGRAENLELHVEAPGLATRQYTASGDRWVAHGSTAFPIPTDRDELRVEVPLRTVAWPLSAEHGPVPPDGTEVRFDADVEREGTMRPLNPRLPFGLRAGRIEAGRLVVDGLGNDAWKAVGRAEDGRVAHIGIGRNAPVGEPIAFFVPRTLVVVALTPEGAPVPKIMLKVEDEHGRQIPDPIRWTNAEGNARWRGVPGFRGSVSVPGAGRKTFSLLEGDVRLEVETTAPGATRPDPYEVALRVRVDGEPRLPARYRIRAVGFGSEAFLRVAREEPRTGTLHAEWMPEEGKTSASFHLTAPGFVSTAVAVAVGEEEVRLDLERGIPLRVRVRHPRDPVPWWRLERWDAPASAWDWTFLQYQTMKLPLPSGESGSVQRYDSLPPGRYRIHAYKRGQTSDVVTLATGDTERELTLDLMSQPRLAGRVSVPKGESFAGAYVEMRDGDQIREVKLDEAGHFQAPWPANAGEVRLVARHPRLRPDERDGTARLRGPREDVALRLVRGAVAELILKLDGETPLRLAGQARVLLLRDGAEPVLLPARITPREDGTRRVEFAGYEPGTWTVWFAPSAAHAPIRIPNATLHDIGALLGEHALTSGSRIRIRTLMKDGQVPELLIAKAVYLDTPAHERFEAVDGVAEIVLRGLEAGRYRVTGGVPDFMANTPPDDLDEVIEVDGRSTYERTIDLR